MFYSSVVFVAFCHFLACPSHPPLMHFLGCRILSSTLVLVILMSRLSLVSCQPFHYLSSCAVTLVICGVGKIKVELHGQLGMAPSCV